MGKGMPKQKKIVENERLFNNCELVRIAMELGFSSKKELAEKSNLKIWEVAEVFRVNKDLNRKFIVMRGSMADVASDNLQAILNDPDHPQHFQATKYVLTTYKTDLDSSMESKDENEIEVKVGKKSSDRPVLISFKKPVR